MAAKIRIPTLTCRRCGHSWVPRVAHVTMCAKCKSIRWDTKPKKRG